MLTQFVLYEIGRFASERENRNSKTSCGGNQRRRGVEKQNMTGSKTEKAARQLLAS